MDEKDRILNGLRKVWEAVHEDDVCADLVYEAIDYLRTLKPMNNETAITHLMTSGWMQTHDQLLGENDLAAVINHLMRNKDKTISINIYPYREDPD